MSKDERARSTIGLGGMNVAGRGSRARDVSRSRAASEADASRDHDEYHARHVGVLLPERMLSAKVLLIGDGSLGSLIADFLVRAGLGALEHYDMDTVSRPNLSRTRYTEADIGRPKPTALNDVLRAIRKDVTLVGHHVDLRTVSDEDLIAAIERAHLVIAATDHPPTQARVAALSYWRKPAILPGVYERATGGEVIFTRPNEGACWHCIFAGIRTEEQPGRGSVDYGVPDGQLEAVPALGTDIANVAVHAARIGIALLHRGSELELVRMVDPARNALFIGNVPDWAFEDFSQNFWARTIRRTDCPVCGSGSQ